jgi:hypothetical protein
MLVIVTLMRNVHVVIAHVFGIRAGLILFGRQILWKGMKILA